MYERVLSEVERFAGAYPAAFALLVTLIVVPLLGSALSFLDGWAAKRWPVAVALLRALLPDPKRAAAILTARVLESQRLPVPPEVRELAIRRVERAADDPQKTPVGPRKPPPLPLLLVIALALVGCTRAEQIQAANAQRTVGHATARTLDELCDYRAADAMPAAEARRYTLELDQRGCEVAWQAQTAFALAHRAQVHAIEAAQRGECLTTTPRQAPACDLLGMAAKTYEAGVDLANAVAAARGAAEAGAK